MKVTTKKYILLLLAAVCLPFAAHADIVVLKSGSRMKGEVLVRNSEVVIIRNEAGARFQFPASEVVEIQQEEQPQEQPAARQKDGNGKAARAKNTGSATAANAGTDNTPSVKESKAQVEKHPVALRVALSAGAACLSGGNSAALLEADFCIGSRNLAGRRIFLGGSIGWHGAFFAAAPQVSPSDGRTQFIAGARHFIPLQAVVSVPLMQGRHAPEIGASLGYGFCTGNSRGGLTPTSHGGLTGGVSLSWRCQMKPNTALLLGWHTQFQQTACTVREVVDGASYTYSVVPTASAATTAVPCTLILTGLQFSLQF